MNYENYIYISRTSDAEYTIRQSADGNWWVDVTHCFEEEENYCDFSSGEEAYKFILSEELDGFMVVNSVQYDVMGVIL